MKKSKYFVLSDFLSYKEITLFFLFFVFLMIVLFPKGRIEELLTSPEETNIDLSKKYLEALIRTKSPENLKVALLRKFAQVGNEEEVVRVIEVVKKENPKIALEVEYDLLKREYFSAKRNKEEIRRKIKGVLLSIMLLEENPEKLKVWFQESVSMNFPELAYLSARRIAQSTRSRRWYEEAFLYAVYSGKREEAKKLIGKFKPTKKETYLLLYYFLIEKHNYGKALRLLEEYITKYPKEREKIKKELMLAYFLSGKFREGERILDEIVMGKNGGEKEKLILTSIKNIMWVGAYEEAKEMIWKYLDLFKKDKKLLTEVLKLSLQTGDPKFAARVAERILREE